MNLTGKKLLVLGATPNEIPLINRAQALGVYVIVTDYNLDHKISPAKDIANEYWDVSWSDTEILAQRCKEKGIDGVTAGFSEFRIDSLIQLTSLLGLPCYVSPEQLRITRDKALFKKTCRKYGVPVIREYSSIDSVTQYPVIVKPVDRAGSIGVGIAKNYVELVKAYEEAMKKSVVKQVIIEDYIKNAVEIDVHYALCDGEIILLCTDDIIPATNNQADSKVVQSAWLYPSRYEGEFLDKVDSTLRKLIRGLGMNDGTVFFSGFADGNGEFQFFECGYRLCGEQEFEYDYRRGLVNYLDIYIYHALGFSSQSIERNHAGNSALKGAAINCYVTEGTITSISGIEKVHQMPDCTLALLDSYIGQKCDGSKAILTKSALIAFSSEDPAILENDVQRLYQELYIANEMGENMLYDRIACGVISTWWDDMTGNKAADRFGNTDERF